MPLLTGSGQNTVFNYHDYKIDREARINQGILLIPVAGPPGTPPKLVRTYAPYMEKTATWEAERMNAPVQPPHWDTGDENTVAVGLTFFPMSPMPVDEFRQAWRMGGEYRYVLAVAPAMSGGFRLAAGAITPAATPTPEENVITFGMFVTPPLREGFSSGAPQTTDLLESIVG